MKKIVALMTVIFTLLMLSSCQLPGFTGGGGDGDPENLIYNAKTELQIVVGGGIDSNELSQIWTALGDVTGKTPSIVGASAEKKSHEIVVGHTSREVSATAYRHLDRLQRDKESDVGFVIYSDGSSVAVAFDADDHGVTLGAALEYFFDNLVKSELILAEGDVYSDSFDLLDKLREDEAEERLLAWGQFESSLPANAEAITASFRSFYGLYDKGLYIWMANLFDPDICVCDELYGLSECTGEYELCGTAGFHYTASARDTVGYLPVVEAMKSILAFTESAGLTDRQWKDYFPEDIVYKMGQFVYHLQDPDGYFYHPQWGKSISTARRGRDLNWCVSLLSKFGLKSKYPTISDVSGVSYVKEGSLRAPLGASVATAVSALTLVDGETYIPEHLVSLEAFRAYLEQLDIEHDSYNIGNMLNSQLTQIRARENATGEPFRRTLGEWLDAHQMENGLWNAETNYFGVNGLMKIAGVYESLYREIPRVDKAIEATLNAITSTEVAGGIVDVWNPWSALNTCLKNLRIFGSGEQAAAVRLGMLENMDEAIDASKQKLSTFLKTDGSFSYHPKMATSTMQGAPCSVPGINEGDMDGAALAMYMVSSINEALGAAKTVKVYGRADGIEFMSIIENASPIRKAGASVVEGEVNTFDFDPHGKLNSQIVVPAAVANCNVVSDPRENSEGNVLYFDGVEKQFEYIQVFCSNPLMASTSAVFESEFCFTKRPVGYDDFRLVLGKGADPEKSVYLMTMEFDETGVTPVEISSSLRNKAVRNELGFSAAYGEWFKLRIEYYGGDHNTTRIKIFINDKLHAVTDNFYDYTGKKVTETVAPRQSFDQMFIYPLKDMDADFYLDNVRMYKTNAAYVKQALDAKGGVNVDEELSSETVYDFDSVGAGGNYPDAVTVTGDASSATLGEAKYLALGAGTTLGVLISNTEMYANCQRLSFDVIAAGAADGEIAEVSLIERNAAANKFTAFKLVAETSDGASYVYLVESLTGKTVNGVRFSAEEITNIRFDYYEKEKATVIYVNGEIKGVSVSATELAEFYTSDRAEISSVSGIGIDDLSYSHLNSSLDEVMAPKTSEKVYGKGELGFDNGDVILSGGAAAVLTQSDSELKLSSADGVTAVKVKVNERDVVSTYLAASLAIRAENVSIGELYEIAFTDGEENVIFSLSLYGGRDFIGVRERTEYGTHRADMATISAVGEHILRIECFSAEGMAHIYVDGEISFVTDLYYNDTNRFLAPKYLRLTSQKAESVIYLDDVRAEAYNVLYKSQPVERGDEDGKVYTFDYSGVGNVPSSIGGYRNYITESLKYGEADKVLTFMPRVNKTDSVNLSLRENGVDGIPSCYVFEGDMCFEEGGKGVKYELNFYNGAGNANIGYRIVIFFDANGVYVRDNDGKYSGEKTYFAANYGEWFNLRAEYYAITDEDGAAALRVKVFLNDELLYVAKNPWKNDKTGGDVKVELDNLVIYSLLSTEGVCHFDNVGFYKSDLEYEE